MIMSSKIDDYNTHKLIYSIFDELKQVYKNIDDNNFDMYSNITTWQLFLVKFYYLATKEKYSYFVKEVLQDQNFINNFKKFIKKEKEDIKKEMDETRIFYRNSYILFLLSLR